MKHTYAALTLALALFAPLLRAAPQTLSLAADTAAKTPARLRALAGETFTIRARVTQNGAPLDTAGMDAAFYWQTNNMPATAWWSSAQPASVSDDGVATVLFTAPAAQSVRFFFRLGEPAADLNYTAFGDLQILASPGPTPNALPLPVPVIDFAAVATTNAPWALPDEVAEMIADALDGAGGGLSPDEFVRIDAPIDIASGNIRLGGGVSARQLNLGANYAPGATNTAVYFLESGMVRDGQAGGAVLGWPQWAMPSDRIATIRDIGRLTPPAPDLSPYMLKFPEPFSLRSQPWELNIYQSINQYQWNSILIRSDDYESLIHLNTRDSEGWWITKIGNKGISVSYDDNDIIGTLDPMPRARHATTPEIWASLKPTDIVVSRGVGNPLSWLAFPNKSGTFALTSDIDDAIANLPQGGGGADWDGAFPDLGTNYVHRIVFSNFNAIIISTPTQND